MKILHVIDSCGLYGAEIMLLNLMEEQVRLGVEPRLASIGTRGIVEKALEREARLRGLSVRPFRMIPGPNLAGLAEVLRFAWEEGVDLIHSHGYKGNILFGLLPRGIRKLPMVTTLHGWTGSGGWNRMTLYEWLDSLSLNLIDRVVLVSAAMTEHPRLKRVSADRLLVVPNGIPAPSSTEVSRGQLDERALHWCREGITIGAIGRLSPEKGFHLLLEAVAHLVREGRNVRLLLIGEGDERQALERRVRELALEGRVLLPGYLPSASDYLPFVRVFALSSLTEGLPLVLLEAMAAGVPVVSTAVGGVPEVLGQGRGGLLVAPGDAEQLAQGMRDVLDDAVGAAERVAFGKEVLTRSYSVRAMASAYHAMYRDLLQEPGAP